MECWVDTTYVALSFIVKVTCRQPDTLSFGDSAELESSCRTWNRLLAGFHPGQLLNFILLQAVSDTSQKCLDIFVATPQVANKIIR